MHFLFAHSFQYNSSTVCKAVITPVLNYNGRQQRTRASKGRHTQATVQRCMQIRFNWKTSTLIILFILSSSLNLPPPLALSLTHSFSVLQLSLYLHDFPSLFHL